MFEEITSDMVKEISKLYIAAFDDVSWDVELAEKRISEFIQQPQFFGCVCKENNFIVSVAWGTLQQYYDGTRFFLSDLFTSVEHQNSGYGSLLLTHLKQKLKERNVKKIMLISSDDKLHNHFYDEKNGFFTRCELCLKQFNLK